MATKSFFDVETALADWRAGLASLSADDVAELESHLLESVAEWRRTGLAEDEAFAIAAHRLGGVREPLSSLGGTPVVAGVHSWWRRVARLAGILAFGAAAVLIKLAISPQLYLGRVLMEIHRPIQMNHAFRLEEPSDVAKSFITNQIAVITAKETLLLVTQKLRLASRWGLASDDEACAKLLSWLRVSRIDDTEMVSLAVLSPRAEEAAELANETASAYTQRRQALDLFKANAQFQALERAAEAQGKAVRQALDQLQSFLKEHQIADLSEEIIGKATDQSLTIYEAAAFLMQQRKFAELEDYGQAGERLQRLETHLQSLRQRLEDRATTSQAMLDNIKSLSEDDSGAIRQAAQSLHEYHQRKRYYFLQKEVLDKVNGELERARLLIMMPQILPEIHERATPSSQPVQPRSDFYWAAACGLGAAGAFLQALSGWRRR